MMQLDNWGYMVMLGIGGDSTLKIYGLFMIVTS